MFSIYLNLFKDSFFVFGCRLVGAVLVFLTQVLLARWMGATELGIYVVCFSWGILLSIVTGLGYPAAALRVIGQGLAHEDWHHIRGFIKQGRQIVAGVGLVAGGLGLALALILGTREVIPAGYVMPFIIAMLSVPVFSTLRLNLRIAHAMSWFKLAFLPNVALRPLVFILIVYAAWQVGIQLTSSIAMLLQLIALCLITIGQFSILKPLLNRELKEVQPRYESRLWLSTATPLLLITLFTQFFPEVSVVLVGSMLPADEVAVFNASFRTSLFIAFGLNAVNAIMIPRVSKLYAAGDREALQQLVMISTHLRFWSALFAVLVLALYGDYVLVLFGEEFVMGYEALMILALSQLVLAAIGPVDVLLSVTGFQKQCLRVFALALALTVILNLILVPLYGITGAAIAVFLVVAYWAIWLHKLVVRHLEIDPSLFAFLSKFYGPSH
jgi:O-antigen/teichoic acid export membrane protein